MADDCDHDAHVRSGIDLGNDHFAKLEYVHADGKVIAYPRDASIPQGAVLIGLHETHKNPAGEWCGGFIGFRNVPEAEPTYRRFRHDPPEAPIAGHTLVSVDPLTVQPSLGCRSCPSHGFIREGKWVNA